MMKTVTAGTRQWSPSKIVCIGQNYTEHIYELGSEIPEQMVIFSKPNSAIASSLAAFHGEQLHYEAEICFLVEGGSYTAVGCGLDLTKRALQSKLREKGLPWERAKAFDGAALFSDFVPLPEDGEELGITLLINSELRQQGNTGMMLYSPAKILAEIGSCITLYDGDIVMTGTPAGVGGIVVGDHFELTLSAAERELVSCSWKAM